MLLEQRAKSLYVQCRLKQHFVSQCVLLPTCCPQVAMIETQVPDDAEIETAETELESKNR